jgi:hypothetical protein
LIMALDTAKVETRSTSDLLNLMRVAEDYHLSALERMELIRAVVADWDRATAGSVPRAGSTLSDRLAKSKYAYLYPLRNR